MSIILSVYVQSAFRELLLPAVNNTDMEIVLDKSTYGLNEDVTLHLENVERQWFLQFEEDYEYSVQSGSAEEAKNHLTNGKIISFKDQYGVLISLIITETKASFSVFRKIDMTNIQSLAFGMEPDNHIQYSFLNLVSRHHAVIYRSAQGFVLQDKSSNGTFINSRKVKGEQILCIGDLINIFGLKIVFLGNAIAIHSAEEFPFTERVQLPAFVPVFATAPKTKKKKEEKKFFHRSPRDTSFLKPETIEIEPPPNRKDENRRPLWMTIGPSFTMMIPMLSGTLMAIALKGSANTSPYMYTGIITAVGSALIGVFWALMNIRYNKKEIKDGEKRRFEAYGNYLIKRADEIRDKYEKSTATLHKMYPAAEVVADYGETSTELWSRNRKHADFICERLGIGNLPFQITINVPKERFTMVEDELSDRPRKIKEDYETLYDVPINIDLLKHKLIGIVGGEKKHGAFALVRLLAAQIAANNCYTDVKMVFIYDDNRDDEDWNYTHWFPHVWSEDKKTRFVASNKSEASDVLYELTSVLRMRAEDEAQRKITLPKPYYILVVSDAELLEGELISKYIYEMESCYGLTTLILTESREQLPNECEFILQNDGVYSGIYDLSEEDDLPVRFDNISNFKLEQFARRLLSIEVNEVEKGRDIPNALTFLEMQQVQTLEELEVAEKWRKNRTYENMRALVGSKAGGQPCYLDVHEKYHGPHGLVAGTTGSGKSETLQTYMLSLAINFSPDDVGYFIIDYKGGGMAGLFDGLPHLIGSISNLSGNQVRRAMVSIKSEIRKRQRIFTENNVNNINNYTKLFKNGEASVAIPHMFIIIDEFAELKREEPEFMKELISVAQVGRSLGVHLILATQKPSGTVDDNIWSNSKFRLCLRVQDRQDSNDMLHKPDAAYITQAGRCYLQVGNDEIYELFQSGFSGAPFNENGSNLKTEIASMLSLPGKAALVGNSLMSQQQAAFRRRWVVELMKVLKATIEASAKTPEEFAADINHIAMFFEVGKKMELDYQYSEYNGRRIEDLLQSYLAIYAATGLNTVEEQADKLIAYAEKNNKKLPEKKAKTQLDAVIEYLGKVAEREGYDHQMELWMPLLPTTMYLPALDGYNTGIYAQGEWAPKKGKWNLSVPIGLCDDPVNQAQGPLTINFSEGGHMAVLGTIVSGKSCFLQSLMYALINKYSPDWVNIYALDFSSRMLAGFEQAPHVGGIMFEDDTEKIDKFFHLMECTIEERKKKFRGGNYSQYVQANGVEVPAIIVVIDNYGAFREKTDNKYDDRVLHLAKEGVSYGIYLALSAAGFANAEIPTKVGDNIKTTICLQMNDKFAYADALRNNHIEVLPESNIKGRGLAIVGESMLEFQTALSVEADDDFKRIEKIAQLCAEMAKSWTGRKAKQIPIIPEKPVWSEYEQLDDVKEARKSGRFLPVGYDMSSADIYGIDLSKTYSFMISGRSRTGKTNLLKAVIRSAAMEDSNLVVFEMEGSDLKSTATAVGAQYLTTKAEQSDFFNALLPDFKARNAKKRVMVDDGKDEFEIFEAMSSEKPYFIIISDIVPFISELNRTDVSILNVKGFVENIAERGKLHNVFFIFGINPDTVSPILGIKAYDLLVGYKTGIHQGGMGSTVRYFDFSNQEFADVNKTSKAGIGMLPAANDDSVKKIVIPLVRG